MVVAATIPFVCFVVAAGSRISVCVARCSCVAEKMLRREGCGNGAGAGARGMDENEGGLRWWCSLEWRLLVREVWWSEARSSCANEEDGYRGGAVQKIQLNPQI